MNCVVFYHRASVLDTTRPTESPVTESSRGDGRVPDLLTGLSGGLVTESLSLTNLGLHGGKVIFDGTTYPVPFFQDLLGRDDSLRNRVSLREVRRGSDRRRSRLVL